MSTIFTELTRSIEVAMHKCCANKICSSRECPVAFISKEDLCDERACCECARLETECQ